MADCRDQPSLRHLTRSAILSLPPALLLLLLHEVQSTQLPSGAVSTFNHYTQAWKATRPDAWSNADLDSCLRLVPLSFLLRTGAC